MNTKDTASTKRLEPEVYVECAPYSPFDKVLIIFPDTADISSYLMSREMGFHMARYESNLLTDMKWDSVTDFRRERLRSRFVKRVPYAERMESERLGLLRWGAWLHHRNELEGGRREDQIEALCDDMSRYGMDSSAARDTMTAYSAAGNMPETPDEIEGRLRHYETGQGPEHTGPAL